MGEYSDVIIPASFSIVSSAIILTSGYLLYLGLCTIDEVISRKGKKKK